MDPRDSISQHGAGSKKLFPYAKDVFYHPAGILSMTVEVYDDVETKYSEAAPVSAFSR